MLAKSKDGSYVAGLETSLVQPEGPKKNIFKKASAFYNIQHKFGFGLRQS